MPFCFSLGHGSCLTDKPEEKTVIELKERLPGEVYSVDKQCQMVFDENSSLCPFMVSYLTSITRSTIFLYFDLLVQRFLAEIQRSLNLGVASLVRAN